jgi:hypothetical protein
MVLFKLPAVFAVAIPAGERGASRKFRKVCLVLVAGQDRGNGAGVREGFSGLVGDSA